MDLRNIETLLAMAPQPGTSGTQPNPTGELVKMVGMLGLMGVMFYFVLLRPQQKRAKEQAQLLKSVKPGDKVVTSGGIIGVVITVKEKTVSLRSADAKLEITKSAVSEILERGGSPGES
jgi:preprotein translocase subunit YajC